MCVGGGTVGKKHIRRIGQPPGSKEEPERQRKEKMCRFREHRRKLKICMSKTRSNERKKEKKEEKDVPKVERWREHKRMKTKDRRFKLQPTNSHKEIKL